MLNFKICLYDNIHNIWWEFVNKFEISQMNKKYEKTLIKHCNYCFKAIMDILITLFFSKWHILTNY
jgi:hypothetical protein